MTAPLKRSICSLFEVHADQNGVQRIITPLEFPGTGDRIVVRVRPLNGGGYQIDENGEAAFYAGLNGGDVESEAIGRWADELSTLSPVSFGDDEVLSTIATDERLVAPYVFRVAEAAQQLHSLAMARGERKASDFKERVSGIITSLAKQLNLSCESDVELPIAGGLRADHLVGTRTPMIVIAAPSSTRLLEAEVIHMQYRSENKPGLVVAIAESQAAVGRKQFERALYYTGKTVVFDHLALPRLLTDEMRLLS